jgi:hypothetical protein
MKELNDECVCQYFILAVTYVDIQRVHYFTHQQSRCHIKHRHKQIYQDTSASRYHLCNYFKPAINVTTSLIINADD